MNKIIILFSFLFVFSIKINAYEYLLYLNPNPSSDATDAEQFALNDINSLRIKIVKRNGNIGYSTSSTRFINVYNGLKYNLSNYIGNNAFQDIYRNDLNFLNDMYLTENSIIPFLNYLYNDNRFNPENYIIYENYQILYDKNGLAVESIVNGVWAGLYDDDEKEFSGKLYGADGGLMYNNGEEVNYIQILLEKLFSKFDTTLVGVFWILGSVVGSGIIAYSVLDTLFFIVNLGVNVFTCLKYGKVNWW